MDTALWPRGAIGHQPAEAAPAAVGLRARARLGAMAISWEMVAYGLLTSAAFVLRIWDVGARAMHHDESLHATYAWYLFQGQGYHYDPLMHGPLQFYVMAFFYMMFGDSETTARLFAVLCGAAMVALPYYLRDEMGRTGALLASAALTISPAFVYFSRFARDDVYLTFFSLLLAICLWRYIRGHRRGIFLLGAASAALAMATMEASYILFFVFGTFVVLALVRERVVRGSAAIFTPALRSVSSTTWIYGAATFAVIVLLLYSTFGTNPSGIWDPGFSLMSPSQQDIWGGITYWLSQHGDARGGQPWFYYLLLFPMYQPFALVFGLAGLVWAAVERRIFAVFLAYWLVLTLVIYSWAGEKMPWLLVHPLLPATLLGAMMAGWAWERSKGAWRTGLVAALALLLLVEAHSTQALAFADGANPTEMLIYVQTSNDVPRVANEVMGLVAKLRARAPNPRIEVDSSDLGGWPFQWYFRNLPPGQVAYQTDFTGAHAPVLLMLGPESDQYGPALRHRYYVGQYRWNWWFPEDYKGLTFDNGRCGTAQDETPCPAGQTGTVFLKTGTPCATGQTANCSPVQSPAAINIFSAVTRASVWQSLWDWFWFRKPFGQRGERPLYVYVRKDLVPGRAGSVAGTTPPPVTQPSSYAPLPYKRVALPNAFRGLSDPRGIALGPAGQVFVADAGHHRVRVYRSDGSLIQSFGTTGKGPGQFNPTESPMDVAVAGNGRVYAADWWGHRIEEFSAGGRYIRAWGHSGSSGPYGFYGPRGLAVGAGGRVYVADTGNERIAVFSPDGRFLFSFGGRGSAAGTFDEPSSVTMGRGGTVLVTDMWNGRLQRFSAGGSPLAQWSVPWTTNSYQEPYAATLPNGDTFVSDPANRRLIEFSAAGQPIGQIASPAFVLPVGVAAAKDGRIFVSDAATNSVLVFTPQRETKTHPTAAGSSGPRP